MAFKPIDPKRDEFRRYLERAGVIEAFTKVFVKLVQERPAEPMEYIKTNLGVALHEKDTVTYLQNELEEAKSEIKRLRSLIQTISPESLEKLDKEKTKSKEDAKDNKNDMIPNNAEGNHKEDAKENCEELKEESIKTSDEAAKEPNENPAAPKDETEEAHPTS